MLWWLISVYYRLKSVLELHLDSRHYQSFVKAFRQDYIYMYCILLGHMCELNMILNQADVLLYRIIVVCTYMLVKLESSVDMSKITNSFSFNNKTDQRTLKKTNYENKLD